MGRLIIDGNSVYEIDDECVRKKEKRREQAEDKGAQQEKSNPHRK